MSTHDAEEDPRNATVRIWVNGDLVPRDEARVSVYDSGFMLGDGVWEGLRLHRGRWAFLDDHLDRLFEAARAIDLDIGLDRAGVAAALEATRAANGMETDAHARLMVTRGRKARPFQHPRLSRFGPTVVIIMEHSVQGRRAGAGGAARHRAAGPRAADEPGPEAQQPLQAQLRARLHPGREGRGRRGADARPAWLRQHHQRLQLLHRAARRGLDLDRRLLPARHHPGEGDRALPRRTASRSSRRTSAWSRPTAPRRRSSPAPSAARRRWPRSTAAATATAAPGR